MFITETVMLSSSHSLLITTLASTLPVASWSRRSACSSPKSLGAQPRAGELCGADVAGEGELDRRPAGDAGLRDLEVAHVVVLSAGSAGGLSSLL